MDCIVWQHKSFYFSFLDWLWLHGSWRQELYVFNITRYWIFITFIKYYSLIYWPTSTILISFKEGKANTVNYHLFNSVPSPFLSKYIHYLQKIIQHPRENIKQLSKIHLLTKKVFLIHPFNFTHKNIKILYRAFNLNIVKFVLLNSLKQIHCTMTTCMSFLNFSAHFISFFFFSSGNNAFKIMHSCYLVFSDTFERCNCISCNSYPHR